MIKKFLLFTVLGIVVFGSTAFAADGDYMIRTWGYGELMYNMIEAVKIFMFKENYQVAVRVAITICIIVFVISYASEKNFNPFAMGQKIIFVFLMYAFLNAAPHGAWIQDMTTGEPARRVENVPSVVGLPLMMFSNIEYAISKSLKESLDATPGGIKANNSVSVPISTALNMLQATSSYRLGDPYFIRTMQSFVERCIMPDIISGYSDIYEIGTGPNFWGAWNSTHPARIGNIYKKGDMNGIDGEIKNCPEVYTYLDSELKKYTAPGGKAWDQIAASMGMAAGKYISDNIGAISEYTFGYMKNAQALLTDAISMNTFNDAYMQIATSAGLDASALSYGMAKSQEMARMNSTMSAIMAKKYLPMAKSYLTVIVVAIIPIIFIIAIATGNIVKPVAMVCGLLVALSLWGVGDQLLDFIVTINTYSHLQGMSGGDFNLMTQPIIEQGTLDGLNLSLGMYWMIPTLSFAIASMSGYAMNSVMGSVGTSTMAGVSGAAGEAVTGSRSMGVIRENMINTNKFDAASSYSGGINDSYMHRNVAQTGVENTHRQTDINEHVDPNGFKWVENNNVRMGQGRDGDGNFQQITQYKGSDGEWHNKEVNTTYGKGVDIDGGRGEKIHLGAGATSVQNADGSISYEGVNSKMGKVSATYGADGGGMITTESGHEYKVKHNSTKEDLFTDTTNVSSTYEGAVNINGQTGSGKITSYGKQGEGAIFNGTLDGKEVSMTLANTDMNITRRGEHDSMAIMNGDVVKSVSETGTVDKQLNENAVQGERFIYSGSGGIEAVNGNITQHGDKATLDGVNAKGGGKHNVDFDNARLLKGDELNKEMASLRSEITERKDQAAGAASFGIPADPKFNKETQRMEQELKAMGVATALGATYVQGDVALQKTETGDTATTHLGAKNITGGADAKGYNVANAMLTSGLSSTVTDAAEAKTFINAASNYFDSILKREGADSLSESQELAAQGLIAAEAKFGADIFGNSMTVKANVNANINASLGHDSRSTDTGSINRIMVQGIYDGLESDKQSGVFNNTFGQFDEARYDAAAVERFGKYEDFLSNELMRQNYGPGNLNSEIINGVADAGKSAIDYSAGKVSEIKSKFK